MLKLFPFFLVLVILPVGACPRDFGQLASRLAKDLHHYINRSYTKFAIPVYAQTVSLPELEPLPVQEADPSIQQLFLKITHRRSGELQLESQSYWLFLVSTPQGWRLAMAFTRVGEAPPIDVSEGAVADAVKAWLRDNCR
ncbi:MAG: hypothetical protein RMK91_11355 [Pseudanabaenaceae cyanobacterium SKYGB_i_bin29]|nr:hypothetical protein [Pseudanabaenaceae cyanobacterium SKYG29]MDW8422450.1 hypothetical protein [Pseudanabaenaceae cyanobacterium SKYGB_i_bin29]